MPYYSPPYVGGMEMRARDRAERLADLGWTVETLTSSEQTYPHTVSTGNLTVRYLRSREIAHTPLIFSLPAALLKVPKGSVVHVEAALAYCPETVAVFCGLRRIPYVVRMALDSAGHTKLRQSLLSAYQLTLLKRVYRQAARVVVLTPDDIVLVTEKYGVDPDKVLVIPNATNFTPSAARTHPHEPFRLLFVGRIEMQKNLPLLLRAVRRLLDLGGRAFRLDIAGDGSEMPTIRRLLRQLSLEEHVNLLGAVTGEALESLYEDSDALVLTSTREAFGQVILEAMTKALPVVASNITGVRSVVRQGVTGLLSDLTEESFASDLHRLVNESDLYGRLSAGALEAAGRYSMEATVAAYARMYEEVAADRSSRGRSRRP
jgi:glycosyltransferase involved in cell wall biosynthesis